MRSPSRRGLPARSNRPRSEGTRRTHAEAWSRLSGWCERNGHTAHPVPVARYLVSAADTRTDAGERAYAVATLHRLDGLHVRLQDVAAFDV
ncbi:hypothetical protein [Rhodococcus sp. G-MC3]|uniref:hypothetical protein n=1 Tax=Rhodococcus sp. G-MC3 TaxID=3046209 RepID=UPI0030154C91